jgi:hypothetical protein
MGFCQNKEELLIVKASEGKKPTDLNNYIDLLAKWRWMVGVSNINQDEDEIAKELILLSQFIFKNYNGLTLDDISNAIDLSLTDKLDVDAKAYNTFSPMYVSRILNAYIQHQRKIMNEVFERKERHIGREIMEQKPSPEVQMENMVELIRYFYDEYKSKGVINDYFNTIYLFFRRNKLLSIDKNIVDEALIYGNERANNYVSDLMGSVLSKEKTNKENIVNRFARNYCIQKIFEQHGADYLISKIKITHFQCS